MDGLTSRPRRRHERPRVDGVSLSLRANETLGLVGESGCGKSTLGRTLVRLEQPTGGSIRFRGEDITATSERSLRSYRREIQFIHQDPSSSLNPRKRVGEIINRPLELHTSLDSAGRTGRVEELLDRVGLDPATRHRYAHELSGGQRQRVEIARALSVNPSVVVADEPTSALDVTVQAQILELLEDLREEFDLAMLFISHDLRTVRYIADRVSVMYLGELIETGPTDDVFEAPRHPYTQSLLASAPAIGERTHDRITLAGEPPDPVDPPSGCRFHPRCPVATDRCGRDVPATHMAGPSHRHRCHYADADVHMGTASELAASKEATDDR
ncbi:ABC transporter ATP-binding protein [Halogeometricum sp. CBA1124]|uniref:ABC transporter ATP-binding protein n=1 Tax=Halogeometricum sp. CBA1124 TaxID=2668071 RepID=UPI00142CE4D2|nr:ATP-binding cassette domain-containing protein [Halogeometricum sp. CBA1124]